MNNENPLEIALKRFENWNNSPVGTDEMFIGEVMKSSTFVLTAAIAKARTLKTNTQTRIGGGEFSTSYWVYNIAGETYIGYQTSEPLPKFFLKKREMPLVSSDGTANAYIQPLNID